MGGGPLMMALPTIMKLGGSLMGGQAAGGGAQAAPAPVNPMTAGLMGGAGGPPPPVPERNPAFSNPAGDANGAKLIAEQPAMRSLFTETMSKPRGVGAQGENAAQPVDTRTPDAVGSFGSQPWKQGETVMGKNVTGQNWRPSAGTVSLPDPSPRAPVQAATHQATPAPSARPAPPPAAAPSLFDAPQPFDTAAPSAPGGGPVAAAKPSLWDGLQKNPIGTIQDKLKGMPTNPLAQTGLGLLASGYDGSNPYTNISRGLSGIQPHEIALRSAAIADQTAARANKKDEQEGSDAELMRLIAAMQMQAMGGAPQASGTPSKQSQMGARVVR